MTLVEWAARRDRFIVGASLLVIIALCWTWIVPMARDMYGPMTGPSAWMMAATWDARYVLLLWAMWSVMMAGMMLPSASPMLLLYAMAARRNAASAPVAVRVYAMAAGYVTVWILFSLGATALQRTLSAWLLITPMMTTATPWAAGAILVAAGLYQFTPFKIRCLDTCRSPLAFIATRWRNGTDGAFRMGFDHGLYCVGCCWALMLLLFVGGVMNLVVIGALTIAVLIEKVAPFGVYVTRLSGVALVAFGVWIVVRSS
jgi:predicted metal-binding membrane protein